MIYYHVFIVYKKADGKEEVEFQFNGTEQFVRDKIAVPYMKGKPFFSIGVFVDPSDVCEIEIYKSDIGFEKLVLPDGKSPVGSNNYYIRDCFNTQRVANVFPCTWEFITSPPKKKKSRIRGAQSSIKKDKVFIVHGRDETQALLLQKYLKNKLKIDAVMFDDLPDKGRTIIEQLEYIQSHVYYAFVIVTPDDLGCSREEMEKVARMVVGLDSVKKETFSKIFENLKTRTRQNVVFELGLFIGALGRDKVCCFLQKDTQERPSDIDGILYKSFDESVKEIFHEVADELKEY